MNLLIVESPSKAKTITKYLPGGYTVKASVGHVRDLPKSNKTAIDIPSGFVPHYEVIRGKEEIVRELKRLAGKAKEVILATDPDREGEAIAWHIAELLKPRGKGKGSGKMKRVAFNEITEKAVAEAMAHPREIDNNLRRAQEARRVLDRLVGYDLSGLIWKKVRYGLSAGRVQSPALRIIVEREREIRAFLPKNYWLIVADTETNRKEKLTLAYSVKPETEVEAQRVITSGQKNSWKIVKIEEERTAKKSRAPFTTSTLQQSASSNLGFNPGKTMRAAQKLYEAGFITYMRTDSTALSREILGAVSDVVVKKYGANFTEIKEYKTKVRNAQEAHEAIRPTSFAKETAGHSEDERRLYALIWARTVASQMKEAIVAKTKIVAEVSDKTLKEFLANGSRLVFPGWLLADPSGKDDDVLLPKVGEGEELKLLAMASEKKQTLPPARYSEAGLIKELEKRGIGRPSTYASIIETLLVRRYADKENRTLRPTDVGEVVSGFLEKHFAEIISDTFTAGMEEELDQIASGEREYLKTLKDFYSPFAKLVKEKNKVEKVTTLGEADPRFQCPKCGFGMVIKLSRAGKFFSCAKFPDCAGALTLDGSPLEKKEAKETGEFCPKCGEGKLVHRSGKFGDFVACSRYPKCRFVKDGEKKESGSGVKCPTCKTGELVERKGRFGLFYSCNQYPKCRFIIRSKPTGEKCKLCGSLMMEGTKTIPTRCSGKTCPNYRPKSKEETLNPV